MPTAAWTPSNCCGHFDGCGAGVGGDADGDHVRDAGFACAGDDGGAVVVEFGLVEMGVGVEELHCGLLATEDTESTERFI